MTVVDLKSEQVSDDIWTYITYLPSEALWVGLGADASQYAFRDTGIDPISSPTRVISVSAPSLSDAIWRLLLGGSWIIREEIADCMWITNIGARLVDPEVAGGVYDDGELLDDYGYHQVLASYTEFIPIGWFGLTDHHTLQIDLEGGYISRNVMSWDEFIAGGRHPYHWGAAPSATTFVLIRRVESDWRNHGYRQLKLPVPTVARHEPQTGPTYTESMYLQLFGTVEIYVATE